jgi:hypothetical protein
MITNKNMSNDELVEKLMNTTMDLYEKDYVRTRDIVRLNDVRQEIFERMDITQEINIDVVVVIEDNKKVCPYGRNV